MNTIKNRIANKGRFFSMLLGFVIVVGSLVAGAIIMWGDNSVTEPNNDNSTTPVTDVQTKSATEAAISAQLEEDKEKGLFLLVNKNNPVLKEYEPSDLTSIKYFGGDRTTSARFMRAEAADKFHKMVEAAKADGFTLVMTTAYRDYNFQTTLYNNYVTNYGLEKANMFSAKPGESEHQTGLAADISSPTINNTLSYTFGETAEGKWLEENCKKYGFILRYIEEKTDITGYNFEPWHFRYVGETAAKIIFDEKLTLEEFINKLDSYI